MRCCLSHHSQIACCHSFAPAQVVEVGKKFFSKSMATAFDDPRVTLIIDDAARYLREEGSTQGYDVIICDSSDPVGPADVLFQPEFFLSMKNALNPKTGVICTQGECQWLHLDFIAGVIGKVRNLFPSVRYAYTTIPTYPSGQIGFLIASVDPENDPSGECPAFMPVLVLVHVRGSLMDCVVRFPWCLFRCCSAPAHTSLLREIQLWWARYHLATRTCLSATSI